MLRKKKFEEYSGSEWKLVTTRQFAEQAKKLEVKTRLIIDEKLDLLLENPFRNKRLHKSGMHLFRIRFSDKGKEKRLIYQVDKPKIIIICILDRKNKYQDLKKYLE